MGKAKTEETKKMDTEEVEAERKMGKMKRGTGQWTSLKTSNSQRSLRERERET